MAEVEPQIKYMTKPVTILTGIKQMVIHRSNLLLKPTQTDITPLLLGPFSPPADYINHGYTKNYLGFRNTHWNYGYIYTTYTLG